MKKTNKPTPVNILIIAVICIVVGAIIFGATFLISGGKLGVYVTNKGMVYAHEEKDKTPLELSLLDYFENIDINAKFADVYFLESDKFAIEATDQKKLKFDVSNNKLTLTHNNNIDAYRMSIIYFGNTPANEKINIYYPKDIKFNNVKFNVEHAKFFIDDFSAKELETTFAFVHSEIKSLKADNAVLTLKHGDAQFVNIDLINLDIITSFTSCDFKEVMVENKTYLKSEHGDLEIKNLDTKDIEVKNKFSDIYMDNINGKSASIYVEHGSIKIISAKTDDLSLDTEHGSFYYTGEIIGDTTIDSKFTDVDLKLIGDVSDYLIISDSEFTDTSLPTNYAVKGEKNHKQQILIKSEHGDIDISID